MARPRALKEKYLDGKELFYFFYGEAGIGYSLNKLVLDLPINPTTGKPFTTMAPFASMWRWALQNLEEAEPIYKKYLLDFGEVLPDDVWKKMISGRVKRYLNKTQQRKFFEEHPEYEI